jgi:DNA-binding NtrC family response regulator
MTASAENSGNVHADPEISPDRPRVAATAPNLLVVHGDGAVRSVLRERFAREGCHLIEAGTAAQALMTLTPAVDIVLLDAELPGADGSSLLRRLKELLPQSLVIVITSSSSVDAALDMTKPGADGYLHTPLDIDDAVVTVMNALEVSRLRREVRARRSHEARHYGFEAIVGGSPAMLALKSTLARVADIPASPLLLIGEVGSGKDLAARVIHYNSERAADPFVHVSCWAPAEELLGADLFGVEQAGVPDAHGRRHGLIERAEGGTLVLENIGDLPPGLQSKLLRFLDDRRFTRIGGLTNISVDVRVIATSTRDLDARVRAGEFREDLRQALALTSIGVPPLRERQGDIPLIANYYIDRYNHEFGKQVCGLTAEGIAVLEHYGWPGNVCELRNVIERTMLLLHGEWIAADDLPPLTAAAPRSQFRLPAPGVNLNEVERELVVQALERSHGNQTHAGKLLGINRDQVRYRIEKFGLAKLVADRHAA